LRPDERAPAASDSEPIDQDLLILPFIDLPGSLLNRCVPADNISQRCCRRRVCFTELTPEKFMLDVLFGLIDLLIGCVPPGRRSPNDKSSRLSDWAGWGLFAVSLFLSVLCGFALLLPHS
jgi:hypothetical protein